MALDLTAALAEMAELRARIEGRLLGIEMLQALPLTDSEHEAVAGFHTVYEHWKTAIVALMEAIQKVISLGYPELPVLFVPQSMLDHIAQILAAIHDAESLFMEQVIAATVKVNFSAPESKN